MNPRSSLPGPDDGLAHVAGGQDDVPRRPAQSLDVVGHEGTVAQHEAGEEHVLPLVVTVGGQMGDGRAVQRGQRGRHGGRTPP